MKGSNLAVKSGSLPRCLSSGDGFNDGLDITALPNNSEATVAVGKSHLNAKSDLNTT